MTQENKELLLKDLCMRLPYKVIIHVDDHDEIFADWELDHTYTNGFRIEINYMCIEDVRPYLRPMSSMTEEERKHWRDISLSRPDWDFTARCLDWLNSRHFDYRGLLERGLALEAPEGMYKI